eukprot:6122238-Amphidinium_carterae.1
MVRVDAQRLGQASACCPSPVILPDMEVVSWTEHLPPHPLPGGTKLSWNFETRFQQVSATRSREQEGDKGLWSGTRYFTHRAQSCSGQARDLIVNKKRSRL